jgi:hypothetical protein
MNLNHISTVLHLLLHLLLITPPPPPNTERRVRVVSTPVFLCGRSRVEISTRRTAIVTEIFHGFPSLQAHARTTPKKSTRPRHSVSSTIQYSFMILSLDAI